MVHRGTLPRSCRWLLAGLGWATAVLAGEPAKVRIIIDADTANEIDDFYAIARALLAPELAVEGLTAASFGPTTRPATPVTQSQQCNEEILALLGMTGRVPALRGAEGSLPDTVTPLDSPAARHIIRRAHAGRAGEKLWVIALGQCTTLASALLLDPTIADKVRFAFIDGDYKDGRWGPGIYNWKNDLHAVKVLFAANVEYFHMPAPSVSGKLKMKKADAIAHLWGRGGIHDYLLQRWETEKPERELWTMWDLALVEAILRPSLARLERVGAPTIRAVRDVAQNPDNPRRLSVWTEIDVDGMFADFWRVLDAHALKR